MDDNDALRARIDELEIRIAHQDRAIEDLNAVITVQWKQIEVLSGQLRRLEDRVQEVGASSSPGLPEPPPPHY